MYGKSTVGRGTASAEAPRQESTGMCEARAGAAGGEDKEKTAEPGLRDNGKTVEHVFCVWVCPV